MRRLLPLGLLLALAGGCDSPRVSTPPAERDLPGASEELLIALSRARSHHAQADLYLADGDPAAAAAALEKILAVPFPAGSPEADDTRLDGRARLARLYLKLDRGADADRTIDEGLAAAGRRSFFLANLYAVSGERHEARARRLAASDPEGARQARRAALAAYDESLRINSELQERLHGTRRQTP
jgi:hypothetical protein